MSDKVKIGEKGRHVLIPQEFSRVCQGKCLKGDFFIDLQHLILREVEDEDIGMDAETFDYLYRKPQPAPSFQS